MCSWKLCTSIAADLVPYSHSGGSESFITTCISIVIFGYYSHMIHYMIIWHVLSKSLYTNTYGDTGTTEMDSATASIYLQDRK